MVGCFDAGKNFPLEGFLSLQVIWGSEDVNLDEVSSSKCMDIKQEAAFRITEDDERLKEPENALLHCHYISSAGIKSKLGVIGISLKRFKTSRKVYVKLFFQTSSNSC